MGNLINLEKKAAISLEKKGLRTEKARVKLVLDYSGSASPYYRNGTIQEQTERILGISMNLDTDQEVEVYTFGKNARFVGVANKNNIEGFIENHILNTYSFEGSTLYAKAMKQVVAHTKGISVSALDNKGNAGNGEVKESSGGFFKKLFGKGKEEEKVVEKVEVVENKEPVFVVFLTDGNNFDAMETEKFMREISSEPFFWQFVGFGDERFAFLQELDDLTGRVVDNADFIKVDDIKNIDDEELYDKLLTEFPNWLKEARSKGIAK